MLQNSFLIIPGIGKKTEVKLWNHGVTTWGQLLEQGDRFRPNGVSIDRVQEEVSAARSAIEDGDVKFFLDRLPRSEYWRIYPAFRDKTVFLDIESTGLSQVYNQTTVITTLANGSLRFFVRGGNLDEFCEYIGNFEVLVTYNGKWFDIPFIKEDLEKFDQDAEPPLHLDLRPMSRSMGLDGGLKDVEQELGITRPDNVAGYDGREATRLWSEFIYGEDKALADLVEYNIYDTVNLRTIFAEYVRYQLSEMEQEITQQQQLVVDGGFQHIHGPSQFISKWKDHFEREVEANEVEFGRVVHESNKPGVVHLSHDEFSITVDKDRAKGTDISIDRILAEINQGPRSVGIDLSASEDAPTGISILEGEEARVQTMFTTDEIVDFVRETDPQIVSIDSPLSLPEGRCCTSEECDCEQHGIIRQAERDLKRRGVNTYPCLIKSMRGLTKRGIEIASTLEDEGFDVIESYPGAAQDIMEIPRKGVGVQVLERGLKDTGLEVANKGAGQINDDELDAITSALVGHFHLADLHEEVGRPGRGIIVPDIDKLPELEDNAS